MAEVLLRAEPTVHHHNGPRWRWMRRGCVAAALAFATVLATASAADAHAALLSSTPAPGSVLAQAPSTIELEFSEAVELPQQAIRLFDATRREIDLPAARHGATDATVTTTLPSLADGGYVVTWRVVSEDGHPVGAAFTFAVGQGTVGEDVAQAVADLAPRGASRTSGVLYGIARAAAYAALALLIGASVLAAFLWPKAFDDTETRRLLVGAGVTATVATTFVYGFEAINTRAGRVSDLVSWDTWRDLASTHTGRWLAVRIALLALTTVVLILIGRAGAAARRQLFTALLVACALVTTSVSATGHASTGRHTTLGIIADVVHVAAFSLWTGGLVLLLAGVLRVADADTARAVAMRFSTLAFASVVALVATGTFMAWRQGVTVEHPVSTAYSRLLLVKIAIVAAVVGAGALSRRSLHARTTREADGTAWRVAIRRTIATEVVLGVAVFSVTAMLVNAAPPLSAQGRPVEIRRPVAGLTIDVVIDPARVGSTELHVYLSGTTTLQPEVAELTVTLSQPVLADAPINVKMFRAGPAHFQSDAMVFPFAGTWTITIGVRTDEFTRDTTQATITVT